MRYLRSNPLTTDRTLVFSAGTSPSCQIHALTVAVATMVDDKWISGNYATEPDRAIQFVARSHR